MKKGDLRRRDILRAAEYLFYKHGYEQTSVQDILDMLSFSKGGFYHHFDSKLSLLEAICELRAEQAFEAAEAAVRAEMGGAVEKLNALFDNNAVWQSDSIDYISLLLQVAYQGEGALMRVKLQQQSLMRTKPLMDDIISEGLATGVFCVPHANLAGELVLRIGAQLADEIAAAMAMCVEEAEAMALILDKLDLYRYAVERTLCAPFGTITLYDMGKMATVCRALISRKRYGAP